MPAEDLESSHISQPAGEPRGGVVVLHAWWGLNDFMVSFSDRLAREGFLVVAPDLYGGKKASTVEEAEALASTIDDTVARRQVRDAIAQLRESAGMDGRGVGIVGFSLGAAFALLAAEDPANDVRTTVVFYGTYPRDFSRSTSAFLGHFAESDPYEPAESVAELKQSIASAGREVEFHTYPSTGHWFFESDRPDAYDSEAAALAWARTAAFLHRYLG